jgi:hypothetical protein
LLGGNARFNYPQIRFSNIDAASIILANKFSTSFRVISGTIRNSMRWQAAKNGKNNYKYIQPFFILLFFFTFLLIFCISLICVHVLLFSVHVSGKPILVFEGGESGNILYH